MVTNKYILSAALAAACSGITLAAQAPAPPQQPAPRTEAAAPSQQGATTTMTGCVYRERDVPGRAPNVAERAGILEDYILAETSTKSPDAGSPAAVPGARGTSGTTAAMYKLELIADDKLQPLVGKRVEVTGRIDAESGDAKGQPAPGATTPTDKVLGRDRIDLSEFEVTSIREIAGTCPATPSGRPQ